MATILPNKYGCVYTIDNEKEIFTATYHTNWATTIKELVDKMHIHEPTLGFSYMEYATDCASKVLWECMAIYQHHNEARFINVTEYGFSKPEAKEHCCRIMMQRINDDYGHYSDLVTPQMDLSSLTGITQMGLQSCVPEVAPLMNEVTQGLGDLSITMPSTSTHDEQQTVTSGERASKEATIAGDNNNVGQESVNTIVMADSTVNTILMPEIEDEVNIRAASTEPTKFFPDFVGRWININTYTVSNDTGPNTLLNVFDSPIDFVTSVDCATNFSVFESFVYCNPTVEVQLVANGVKMYAGKLIMGVEYDINSTGQLIDDTRNLLALPHVEVDLDAHNSAVLTIPNVFPRVFLDIHRRSGIRNFINARVYIGLLDRLRIGADQAGTCRYNVKFRFVKCEFAGLATRKTLSASVMPQVNTSRYNIMNVYNSTRMDFSSGFGKNIVQEMRLTPGRITSYRAAQDTIQDPKTIFDLVNQWGYVGEFTWSSAKGTNALLYQGRVEPSYFDRDDAVRDYEYRVSPLEVLSSYFAYWRGPIEVMFKCISSQFHTGELMVSVAFGRDAEGTVCQAKSGYSKYFVLGSQKTFNMIIPYIYSNVWRRNHNLPIHSNQTTSEYSGSSRLRTATMEYNPTRLRVHVVTPLNYISNCADEIKIIMMARASPGFSLSVPTMGLSTSIGSIIAESIPQDLASVVVKPQINTGGAEVVDPTPNFNLGKPMRTLQVQESFNSILEILQRPILFADFTVPAFNNTLTANCFYVPVTPLFSRFRSISEAMTGCAYTLQQQILSMFKLWRGSMRYTFEFYNNDGTSGLENLIIIQHIPHSGIELVGVHQLVRDIDGGGNTFTRNQRAWGTGLGEVHVRPSIQPTVTVEVPYYTENAFTRMVSKINVQDNVNELTADNAGLIRIFDSSNGSPIKCRMYVHVGDDFQLKGYWFGTGRGHQINKLGDTITDELFTTATTKQVVAVRPFKCSGSHSVKPQVGTEAVSQFFRSARDTATVVGNAVTEAGKEVGEFISTHPGEAALGALATVHPPLGVGMGVAKGLATASTISSNADKITESALQTSETMRATTEYVGDNLSVLSRVVGKSISAVQESIMSVSARTGQAIELVTDKVQEIFSTLLNLFKPVQEKFQNLFSKDFSFGDFFFDFINLMLNPSAVTFALTVSKFLVRFGLIDLSTVMSLSSTIQTYVSSFFITPTEGQVQPQVDLTTQPNVISREDSKFYSTMCGIFVGIIASTVGIANPGLGIVANLIRGVKTGFQTTGFWSIVRNASVVFENLMGVFHKCLTWVMSFWSEEAGYATLFKEHTQHIIDFCNKAQTFSLVMNRDTIASNPKYKVEMYEIVLQAMTIKTMISTSENAKLIKNTTNLMRVCDKLIDTFNDISSVLTCSPVRYEPFVICIYGESGVGKSYMATAMVKELLKEIGYVTSNPDLIYVRNGASDFWDGFHTQPVVMYDDWMALKDPQANVRDLDELFKLKSSAVFIPNQAALSNKEKRANPLLVVHLCNTPFPDLQALARCPPAVYRRRDVLVHMGKIGEHKADFSHATFNFHDSGAERQCNDILHGFEGFLQEVKTQFKAYHETEMKNVDRRNKMLAECLQNSADIQAIVDPFTTLNRYLSQTSQVVNTGFLPSEVVAAVAHNIVSTNRDAAMAAGSSDVTPQILGGASLSRIALGIIRKIYTAFTRAWNGHDPKIYGCSVCLSTSVMRMTTCVNDTKECFHGMCMPCYNRWIDQGTRLCPVCRGEGVSAQITEDHQHFIARLLGTVLEWCDMPYEAQQVYTSHLMSNGAQFLWDCCTSLAWMSAAIMCENPYIAMFSLYNYYVDAINIISSLASMRPQVDTAQISALEIPSGIVYNESQVRLYKKSTSLQYCLHRAFTLDHAWENKFVYNFAKDSFIAMYDWVYAEDGYHIEVAAGDQCPLEHCSRNDCIMTLDHLKKLLRIVICRGNSFKTRFSQFVSKPHRQLPLWLQPQCSITPEMIALREQFDLAVRQVQKIEQESWLDWIMSCLSGWWKTAAIGITVVSAVIGIFSGWLSTFSNIVSFFGFGEKSDGVISQVKYDGANQPVRLAKLSHKIVSARCQVDVGDCVRKKIISNSFMLEVCLPSRIVQMRAVGILGKIAILPKHYISFVKWSMERHEMPDVEVRIQMCRDTGYKRTYMWSQLVFDEAFTTDLATLSVPNDIPMFANLVKYMPPSDTMSNMMVCPKLNFISVGLGESTVYIVDAKGLRDCNYAGMPFANDMNITDCLVYNHEGDGECGSLITQDTNNPIIAMHIAGGSQMGYGVLLVRETFDHLFGTPKVVERDQIALSRLRDVDKSKVWFSDECQVDYLGTVAKELTPYMPSKSKIVPSLIHAQCNMPVMHEPAILSKQDARYRFEDSPLVAGCNKHGLLTNKVDAKILNIASGWLQKVLLDEVKPKRTGAPYLTLEEGIIGIPALEFYDCLDLNTSAGWPFTCIDNMKSKKDWLDVEAKEDGTKVLHKVHDTVLEIMEKKHRMRLDGVIPFTVFEDHLKDEKLHVSKVREYGKTRVFCMCPIDFTIQVRQYFLDFCAAYMDARIKCFHGVGINCDGWEWNRLYSHLNRFPNWICLDYKNFGPGFNVDVSLAAYNAISYWYRANFNTDLEADQVRHIIAYECSTSMHVCMNLIYAQAAGSPSGAPLTTYHNSTVNKLYVFMAYIMLCIKTGQHEYLSLTKFLQNVYFVVYGDDICMTVSSDIPWFNQNSIIHVLGQYNIILTSGVDKNRKVLPDYEVADNATFLKRRFVPYEHRVLAPLDIDSVYSCAQFVRKINDMKEATLVNAESCLRLAYGHGRVVFEEIKSKLNKALLAQGIAQLSLTWDELDVIFFPISDKIHIF